MEQAARTEAEHSEAAGKGGSERNEGASAPRWRIPVRNDAIAQWKASFMDLPESQRPLFLRLTGCAPPAVLGDSIASQLAFRRMNDMFQQARGKQKLFALIDAAERATEEMTSGSVDAGSPHCIRPGLDARFMRTWDEAALREWCDRIETHCAPHGVLPSLRMYG
jgi:uncharacterized metal-binding protein